MFARESERLAAAQRLHQRAVRRPRIPSQEVSSVDRAKPD